VRKKTLAIVALMAMAAAAPAQLDTVWIQTYGGSSADGFRAAIPTSDGGFIALGYTYSYRVGDMDLYAVKTDASGAELWARAFGGPGPDCGYGVCETDDGAYVMAGFTMSGGAGGEDVWLIKVDEDGNPLWSRRPHRRRG
jgi:hypothetical protein